MVAKGNTSLIGREVTQVFIKKEEGWLYFLSFFFSCSYSVGKKKQKQKLPCLLPIHSLNSQEVSG
jgi:hypothetical protein